MITHRVNKKKEDGSLYTVNGMQWVEENEQGVYAWNPVGDKWYNPSRDSTFVQFNATLMFFPKNEWYNLLYYFDSRYDGAETIYINLANPYHMEGEELTFVDYDLDLILRNDKLTIDDLDEWQERKTNYPPEVIATVEQTLHHLITQLVAGTFEPLAELRARFAELKNRQA